MPSSTSSLKIDCIKPAGWDLSSPPDCSTLTGPASPKIIADASTVSALVSETIREAANSRGADFLATPVSGNPKVIAAGKLTVAVSGPREVFESIEPILNVFGRGATYVGEGEGPGW